MKLTPQTTLESSIKLTAVSMEIVAVDYKVLAEMSDGTIVELSVPYGPPKATKGWQDPLSGWRFKTREQLVELARNHNCDCKNHYLTNLHNYKETKFGHG